MVSKSSTTTPHRINPFDSRGQSRFALRFFLITAATFSVAVGIAFALAYILPATEKIVDVHPRMPRAFVPSTLLLLLGSYTLAKAISFVRRERQLEFRRCLLKSLAFGTLFVGIQSYGLWNLVVTQIAATPDQTTVSSAPPLTVEKQQQLRKRPMGDRFRTDYDIATGANGFVLVFVTLHGLHFFVALLCLIFVMLQAYANRYDHEYHWGVTVCSAFWHLLGLAWFAILAVFAITMRI